MTFLNTDYKALLKTALIRPQVVMISKEKLDCGSFEIYDNYIISTINEGIVIDQACKDSIWKLCDTHFEGKTFGYISNRRHSYSIDPTIYLKADDRFSNL